MQPPNPREAYTDAAKRMCDIINNAILNKDWDTISHSWVAIRLSDGGSDGVLYESKLDAVRHQLHEMQCAYVALRNLRAGTNPIECQRYLDYNRKAYDAGFRLPDPDAKHGGPELFLSTNDYDTMKGRSLARAIQRAQLYLP